MTVAEASPSPDRSSPGLSVYYSLIITQTVSLIGSQVSEYAIGVSVFRSTGHATPLALIAFFTALPPIVFGGFGGALADRFDRRTMMIIANLGFVATSSLLLLCFSLGAPRLWRLYALTFAASSFAALGRPAFQASVALLVPDRHRDRANAIGQLAGSVGGVIGPAAGGVLYAAVGVAGSISVDIATFVAAICVLAVARIPRPPETAEGRSMRSPIWRQAFDGFRYLAARPALLGFCGYVSVVNFVANAAFVLLTPYVLARTGAVHLLGIVLTVMNGGGIIGSLVVGARDHAGSRMRTVFLAIIAAGLFLALAGIARNEIEIATSLFLLFFALAFSNAPFWSMMQAKVAPDLQGRVFSAYLQAISLMSPLAFAIAGPLADHVFEPARRSSSWRVIVWLVGPGPGAGIGLMLVLAGGFVLALSLAVSALPAVRRLETGLPDYARAQT